MGDFVWICLGLKFKFLMRTLHFFIVELGFRISLTKKHAESWWNHRRKSSLDPNLIHFINFPNLVPYRHLRKTTVLIVVRPGQAPPPPVRAEACRKNCIRNVCMHSHQSIKFRILKSKNSSTGSIWILFFRMRFRCPAVCFDVMFIVDMVLCICFDFEATYCWSQRQTILIAFYRTLHVCFLLETPFYGGECFIHHMPTCGARSRPIWTLWAWFCLDFV